MTPSINDTLKCVENYQAETKLCEHEFEVYSFPQTWSDTSCGFGGVAGQAFTTTQVTVILHFHNAWVYIGTRLAYIVDDINHAFMNDLRNFNMCEVWKSSKYRHKNK